MDASRWVEDYLDEKNTLADAVALSPQQQGVLVASTVERYLQVNAQTERTRARTLRMDRLSVLVRELIRVGATPDLEKIATFGDAIFKRQGSMWRLFTGEDVFILAQRCYPNGDPPHSIANAIRVLCHYKEKEAADYLAIPLLEVTDAFSAAVMAQFEATSDPAKALAVCKLARQGTSARPSKAWLKKVAALDPAFAVAFCLACVQRFADPIPEEIRNTRRAYDHQRYDDMARGMAWMIGVLGADAHNQVLRDIAFKCYRRVPGYGPRSAKIGNACVWAISEGKSLEAAAQLAIVMTRVKHKPSRRQIEKALVKLAQSVGVTRNELDEMSVPDFELIDGALVVSIGEAEATLAIDGHRAVLSWKSNGKPVKSVPAVVKREHADALKDLRASKKEIDKVLASQKSRLERMLATGTAVPRQRWLDYYWNHPLVGTLSRRLFWVGDGAPVLGEVPDGDQIKLWHPINANREQVAALREQVWDRGITQPFKQAHREVYRLTDAERATNTYSNRFAAHILKQSQFRRLAQDRGWSYELAGGWDGGGDTRAARCPLPTWDLHVEYWVLPLEEFTDEGFCLYVSTDQVRFSESPVGLDPIPLQQVPALALSESMRDVDLFVGVASVGADPEWFDQGDGPRRVYWDNYSFGALSETAKTRREILERLLPKLAVGKQCKIVDRFVHVEGKLRTYKIHLGSGNILMTPNDQYLCIVGTPKKKAAVTLPFEGDAMMSLILSKVLMLAKDDKIKDPTIVSQLR